MGFLTTVILHNDANHAFEKDPKAFGEAILSGMDQANYQHKQVDVGFGPYCNYISVEPSRHADDTTVYLHYGNTVTNLNAYNEDFKSLMERNPELAQKFLNKAKDIIKTSQKKLNEIKKSKKELTS
jgi:hypothetical protein